MASSECLGLDEFFELGDSVIDVSQSSSQHSIYPLYDRSGTSCKCMLMCSVASELVFGNIIINPGAEGGVLGTDTQANRRQLASDNHTLGMHCRNNGSANYACEYQWGLV